MQREMKKQKRQIEPLFTSADDWHYNACLNWSHDPLELYTIGYKDGADRLVNAVLESKNMQDALIYPICFLYRQYIELRLKEIINSGRMLLGEGRGFPQHHKISSLYETAKEIIKEVYSGEELPDLSLVDHVVSEYSDIDPDSFSFRYPFDKSGRNVLGCITHINLRHLSNIIKEFGEVIDNISCAISVCLDHKREFSEF